MKKSLAAVLFLVAIVVMLLHLTAGKESLYSDICITQEERQTLIEGRRKAQDALFTRILFNEYELIYDKGGNRLFYSLIENSDNAYNPYVKCVSEGDDIQLAIVGNTITKEGIVNGEEFEVLVYNEEEYQSIRLVFTTLPLLSLYYDGEMGEYDTMQLNMKLFDNRRYATQRMFEAEGEIRIRGRYSRNFPKDGYRITLYADSLGENRRELETSLLGMRQDGDWLLYAAYNDKEKVRNVFSSNLWKESCASNNALGLDNGMEYKYVEVFLNEEYWGLYALGYPIDSKQLQMTDGEYMYKKTDPYLSELAIDYDKEGAVPGYEIKELGTNLEEDWSPLKEYYQTMLNDDADYSQLRDMVDIQNSLDIFLFLNMIQGVDHANLRGNNIIHNLYMTNKISREDGTEVMIYTPWDMDRTWGYGFDAEWIAVSVDQNVLMQTNIVYLLLEQQDQEMMNMLVERYNQLRESTWSDEHLISLTLMYEEQIFNSGAYRREMERWPEANYIEEEHRLNLFRSYLLERMKYMDMYIGQYN